jgi:thiol-disulfide isomerase/thioredoxin
MKKIFIIIFLFIISFSSIFGAEFKVIQKENTSPENPGEKEMVFLNLFERKDCAHCQDELSFLENLKEKDFYLNKLDIAEEKNLKLFNQIIEKYNLSASTPLNLIGDSIIVGFDNPENTGKEILEKIAEAKKNKKFNLNIDYYLNSKSEKNLNDSAPGCDLKDETGGCSLDSEPKIKVEQKKEVSLFG